jgi:hypothetical protein
MKKRYEIPSTAKLQNAGLSGNFNDYFLKSEKPGKGKTMDNDLRLMFLKLQDDDPDLDLFLNKVIFDIDPKLDIEEQNELKIGRVISTNEKIKV